MSTSILASTSNPVGSATVSADTAWAADIVIVAEAVNPIAGVLTPVVSQLLLSNNNGSTFVLADAKRHGSGAGETMFQAFVLANYAALKIPQNQVFGTTSATYLPANTSKTVDPPWTNFMLRFVGNEGNAVTVSAVYDGGGAGGGGEVTVSTAEAGQAAVYGIGGIIIGGVDQTGLEGSASNLIVGTVPIDVLGSSGTPSSTTFLNGLNAWATPGGTITEISETSSFTAVAGNYYVVSGSANITATLQTAVGVTGQPIQIRCASGYTGQCTITTTDGQTIAGASSRIIFVGESPLLRSDGANWVRAGGLVIPAHAQITLGSAQTVPNSTATTITLNTPGYDNTGQMLVLGSSEIQIPRPGQYRVTGVVLVGPITTSTSDVYFSFVRIFKNGSGTALQTNLGNAAPGFNCNLNFDVVGSDTYAAGDLLTMTADIIHSGGQSLTITPGSTFLEVEEMPSW
jgi:hypothetical protein